MKFIGKALKAVGGTALFVVLVYLFYAGGQDLLWKSPAPAPAAAPALSAESRPDSFVSRQRLSRSADVIAVPPNLPLRNC